MALTFGAVLIILLHKSGCKPRAKSNNKENDDNSDGDFIPVVAMASTLSSCPGVHKPLAPGRHDDYILYTGA